MKAVSLNQQKINFRIESGATSASQVGQTDVLKSPDISSLKALNQSADHIQSSTKPIHELKSLGRDMKNEDQSGAFEHRQFPKIT